MPVFGQDSDEMQVQSIGGGAFEFSGAKPETLGATEYTLVTIVCDRTGSVSGFEAVLLTTIKNTALGCQKCPEADNLLLRYVTFADDITEVHGFQPLRSLDPKVDYPELRCNGSTALYDAVYESVSAMNAYAKTLTDNDFAVNGIVFVITDGDDNASRRAKDPTDVGNAITQALQDEYLESFLTILVGVNASDCKRHLDRFHSEAGITQFINIDDFHSDKTGARLAGFISKSISSQSQALGTGGPSQSLSF